MNVSVEDIVRQKSSRRWRRWLWILPLVLLVLGGFWIYHRHSAGNATTAYSTAKAATGDITVTVAAVGTVQPVQIVDVTPEVVGTIVAVPVAENQPVKTGQVLARIDTSALEATIARDKASVAVQEAALEQAKATNDESAATLQRQQQLMDRGIATQESLASAVAAAKRARAGLAAAEAQKAVALADLQLAKVNLAKACICAPIDGVVLTSNATLGQAVGASTVITPLFTIAANLRNMELQLDVDEADVGKVKPGDAASFTVEAYQNRKFAAKVTSIAYASQTVDGVVSYTTTLTIDNHEGLLRPGMTAAADITVEKANGVLTVPNAAFRYAPPVTETQNHGSGLLGMLFSAPPSNAPVSSGVIEGGMRSLWVLRNGVPKEIQVKTGVTDGTKTQILSGPLTPGEAVITGTKAGG